MFFSILIKSLYHNQKTLPTGKAGASIKRCLEKGGFLKLKHLNALRCLKCAPYWMRSERLTGV